MLRRYANTDFRSSSVIFPYPCHGIGGWIGRPWPQCLPVRIAWMNICSSQIPRPMFLSGVRLAAYVTPQGPENAVLVAALDATHGPCALGAGGSFICSG